MTMEIILQTEAPPLRRDASGALRIGHSRVLLELVIRAFEDGATPEAIAQRYSTATLADIYAVIAYYLRHRQDVEAYLAERAQRAREVRQRIERRQGDLSDLRERLLARRLTLGEEKYGILSEDFYAALISGQLADYDAYDETRADFSRWKGIDETLQRRKDAYRKQLAGRELSKVLRVQPAY